MTLSNSIFAVSGKATFLDARKDMSNLFICDTSLEPHPGLLTVGGNSAANGNVVVGMSNRMAVTVRPFQAVLNRLGALLIMNDGDVVVPLQAAPSANSRIDVVYVKQRERRAPISDSEDGPILGVVTGTANLTPVAPQVPDGAVALAQVKVPSGVTNTTAGGVVITQVYPFAATRGEELRFRTKSEMDAFAALDGTKAITVSDNTRYVRENSEWINTSNIKLLDGTAINDWNVNYRCSLSGKIVSIDLKVTRKNTNWSATAWQASQILKFPDYLKPQINDVNIYGAGQTNSGFQLDPGGLSVRPFADITYNVGSWSSAAFSYTVK